jgi:hypothetical protein
VKNIIDFFPLFLVLIVLLFSFFKTPLRTFAIAWSGLLLGVYLLGNSLKEHGQGNATMASMGTGLGEALLMAALLIAYLIYLLVLLIVWWRFNKNKNTTGALHIKRGLLWSLIIFVISAVLSFFDAPRKIKYAVQEKNAKAEFKYQYNLLTDSISKNSTEYSLYFKRAALGESFIWEDRAYAFGNAATIESDAKKAYSLHPNDYDFVSALANVFYSNGYYEAAPADSVIHETSSSSIENTHVPYIFFLHKAHLLLLDSLNKEINNNPTNGKWYYERGELYKEMKDTTNAILDFEKLQSVQPKHNYTIYKELADYYLKKGDLNKSNMYYRKHIGDYTFREGPFEYLSARGRLKEDINLMAAINDYKEALKYKRDDYSIMHTLNRLYLSLGDTTNAKLYDQ